MTWRYRKREGSGTEAGELEVSLNVKDVKTEPGRSGDELLEGRKEKKGSQARAER